MDIFAVFIGGGLGSIARYLISKWVPIPESGFPMATFIANLLACIILASMAAYVTRQTQTPPYLRLLIMTGFCGGFSTFSTFSLETMTLIERGAWSTATLYVSLSILVCVAITSIIWKSMA